jgi:hypothetical protein
VFKQLWVKFLLLLVISTALAAGFSACGSSGTDTAALKQEGRKEQLEKEKGQRLERKIQKIERERRQEKKRKREQERDRFRTGPDSSAPAAAPSAPEPAPAPSGTSCGSGVTAGPETTCGFALNVRAEYYAVVGEGSGEFEAYSPTLNEWFPMYCTGAPHECSGAITATVYFP